VEEVDAGDVAGADGDWIVEDDVVVGVI